MNIKKIIIIAVLTILVILAAFAFTVKIKTVTVTGNEWYTAEEIESMIFDKDRFSRNTVYQFVRQLFGKKDPIPFVEDYKLIFNSFTDVEVIVYEKSIVAYVKYMGNYMYFDKDGIVVDSSTEPLDGIPEITGLKFGNIVLYKKLPVEDPKVFDDILNLTQALHTYGIRCSRINYSDLREATLYLGDIVVELGTDSDMVEKVSELRDILPELRTRMEAEGIRSGTLYLDSYDSTSANTLYSFKKN